MLLRPIRLAALACALAAPFGAFAQTSQSLVDVSPDDWVVHCEETGCLVTRGAFDAAGSRLLTLTFALSSQLDAVRMVLLTPLGTALQSGLQIYVGTQEQAYNFAACTPDGCMVIVDLPPDQVQNMTVQPALVARFFAINQTDPYEMSIPLEELGEAIRIARNGGVR
jgi:invasion protein IalB